jgi:hypothetical protein
VFEINVVRRIFGQAQDDGKNYIPGEARSKKNDNQEISKICTGNLMVRPFGRII